MVSASLRMALAGDAVCHSVCPLARAMRRAAARLQLAVTAGVRAHDPIVLSLLAALVLSVYFLVFPGVDMAVTSWFHVAGQGFPASQEPALKALRKSSSWVLGLVLLAAIVRIVWTAIHRRAPLFAGARRSWFLLAGLVAGPGLLVNTVLKNNWGRPRPIQLEAFGGEAPYVPVWEISDWCRHNCSFVSGEGSSAAWMVAALMLLPAPFRAVVIGPALVYSAALSMNRLAFGGHFLSDILLSWALTGLVMAVLYRLMVAAPGAARARRVRRVRPAGPPLPESLPAAA
jgi:lipid A 4'-phosphatase